MNPENKRRAARARHDSILEIYDEGGHFITAIGRLINFSKVGVCFSSSKTFAVGDRLQARLRLLREGMLEVSAHVVWAKKKPAAMVYGLAFDAVKQLRA